MQDLHRKISTDCGCDRYNDNYLNRFNRQINNYRSVRIEIPRNAEILIEL
ncbi:MAG: hypothetical protein QNJ38_07000 [Prochloraceae cyanobacterium]|nr:hypothetical protein [Prochloraceae cyanobacterium]